MLGQRGRCASCQATVTEIKKAWRIQAHDCVSFWGKKNWKFNTAVISARKNRPLFFSKPKLVQNIGLCGNSRLPAAQLRKPHDKANLKREESVCLLKVSQGKRVGFSIFFFLLLPFRTTGLSLGSIPVGLEILSWKTPNGKCERSHLSIHPCWCLTHHFSAPPANGFCEQLEVDFPSVSDHSISISGQGAPTVKQASQETRFSLTSGLRFAIYSSLTVSEASLKSVYDLTLPQS